MPLDGDQARRLFATSGFTFLFAPNYHPAFAAVGPVRRALGVRTVFNILVGRREVYPEFIEGSLPGTTKVGVGRDKKSSLHIE
jgi:hypothetical protein